MASDQAEWRQKILGALRELKSDYRREERAAQSQRDDAAASESGARQPATAA